MEPGSPQVEAHRLSREGCSGAEVARRLGVTRMTISRWLRDPGITAAAEAILSGAPSQSSSTPSQARPARRADGPGRPKRPAESAPSQSSSTPLQTEGPALPRSLSTLLEQPAPEEPAPRRSRARSRRNRPTDPPVQVAPEPEPPAPEVATPARADRAPRERPAPRPRDDEPEMSVGMRVIDPPRASVGPGDPPWLEPLLDRLCRGTEMETAVMFAGVMPRVVCAWVEDGGEAACVRVLQAYAAGQAWREDIAALAIDRANGLDARLAYQLLAERRAYQAAQAAGHLIISDVWGSLSRVLRARGQSAELTPAMVMIERLGFADGKRPAELDLMESAG